MRDPRPEWEETLLLLAYGELEETPEIRAELGRNPAHRAYLEDLRALRAAADAGVRQQARGLEPPGSALARALVHFEGQAGPGLLERLRTLVLVPALAGLCAFMVVVSSPAPPAYSWDMARLEARMDSLEQDLWSTRSEVAGQDQEETDEELEAEAAALLDEIQRL